MFNKKMNVAVIGCVTALALILGLYTPPGARADEKDARNLVKAMPDPIKIAATIGAGTPRRFITKTVTLMLGTGVDGGECWLLPSLALGKIRLLTVRDPCNEYCAELIDL